MSEDPKTRQTLIRIRPGDRLPLFLLSLIFIFAFGCFYYAIGEWQPTDTGERVVKFLGREMSLTLVFFAALVFIRCFVSSVRLENVLSSVTRKILIAMMLVVCALAALFILVFLNSF